jgi:hypothetical protein
MTFTLGMNPRVIPPKGKDAEEGLDMIINHKLTHLLSNDTK